MGDPTDALLPARRLLFVHAHPDDEASKGAATAARYADEGARVTLVCCTGGEAGDVLNEAMAHVSPDMLPSVREAELARSVAAIGFAAVHKLGYRDSGWHEDLTAVPLGTFWHADLDEAGARLATVLRADRPQVVVTYPEDGGYPHPDHIKVHAVTMRALELAARPGPLPGHPEAPHDPWHVARVYASTVHDRDKMHAMHDAHLEAGHDSPFGDWIERLRNVPEVPTAARVHVGEWLARRDDALRAHATQIDPDGFWFRHSRDIEADVAPWESFLAIRPEHDGDQPLTDLFEGLAL